jgi:hypothetical protein
VRHRNSDWPRSSSIKARLTRPSQSLAANPVCDAITPTMQNWDCSAVPNLGIGVGLVKWRPTRSLLGLHSRPVCGRLPRTAVFALWRVGGLGREPRSLAATRDVQVAAEIGNVLRHRFGPRSRNWFCRSEERARHLSGPRPCDAPRPGLMRSRHRPCGLEARRRGSGRGPQSEILG